MIVCQETGLDKQMATQLVALGNDLRKLKDHGLEETASTRLIIYTAMMINSGLSPRQACTVCLAQPMTDDSETLLALERVIDAYF